MDTTTPTQPSQWTLGARRALALALIKHLPEGDELRDYLTGVEIEWAVAAGFPDPEVAYEADNLPRVLLWDFPGNRDANTVFAEIQDIPELGAKLNELLKYATYDVLASPDGRDCNWSERTSRLLEAFELLLPMVDINSWVSDIAGDRAIEVDRGFTAPSQGT